MSRNWALNSSRQKWPSSSTFDVLHQLLEPAFIHWLRKHDLYNLFEINESHRIVYKGDAVVGLHVHIMCVIVEFISSNLLCIRKWIKGKFFATCCSAQNKVPAEIFIAWSALLFCLYVGGYVKGKKLFRRTGDLLCETPNRRELNTAIQNHHNTRAAWRLASRFASHSAGLTECLASISDESRLTWIENNASRVKSSLRFNWFIVIVFHYVPWIIKTDNRNLFLFPVPLVHYRTLAFTNVW